LTVADRYSGVPDQEPSLEAPNDLQHEQATPASFGGEVAQGLEAAGQGAFKAADFYGQVAANQATNNYLDERDKVLYGDPSKGAATDPITGQPLTAPDGGAVYNGGYFGLRGQAALEARPQVAEQLDEIAKDQAEGLQTPMARQQFEVASRRYRAQALEQVGSHADNEEKTWAKSVNQTTADLALGQVARTASDDTASAAAGEGVRAAYLKTAQIDGLDTRGALLRADQDVALTRIRALIGDDDPAKRAMAETVLDRSTGILGSLPQYDQIVRTVRGAVVEATLDPTVDGLVSGALSNAQASGAPSAPFLAKGPGYDRIASTAQRAGATPAEIDTLQRFAHAESGGNPNAMNEAGTRFGIFQYPHGGPQSVEDQTSTTLTALRQNTATLTRELGRPPTEAELYLMHQQGPAGGPALLTAPADMSAVQALTPAYHGNVATATAAIAGNIGLPYKTPEEKAAANQAASAMTAGQFRDQWSQKFGGGTAGAAGGMSVADSLRERMPQLVENARTTLEKQFPNQPDVVDRGVDRFERQLNLQITQQDQQYAVDAHIVQAAMAGKPISEQDLISTSPQVAAAWQRLQTEDSRTAAATRNMFDANSHGAAVVYGTQFKGVLDRVLAPASDPDVVKNPTQLYSYVGSSPDAPLTNSGVEQVSRLTALRGSPQGEAQLALIKGFVDNMHGQLSASNRVAGYYDEKGEAAYSKFIGQALPILERAAKDGTLSKVIDPNNPDYLGNAARPFMRSQAQMIHDRITYQPPTGAYTADSLRQDLDSLDNDAQRSEALHAAVASHRLTPQVYQAYLLARQGAGANRAALVAPPPAPAPTTSALTDAQARAKLRAEGLNEPGL
jgi:hypothetical protein